MNGFLVLRIMSDYQVHVSAIFVLGAIALRSFPGDLGMIAQKMTSVAVKHRHCNCKLMLQWIAVPSGRWSLRLGPGGLVSRVIHGHGADFASSHPAGDIAVRAS